MDLKAVHDLIRLPTACDAAPVWEGRVIAFSGYLDHDNVYFRATHPQLPYEKFAVVDGRGRSMEVWPQGTDNSRLYARLIGRPADVIVVKGCLTSFKMPAGERCARGAKVVIHDAEQIQFVAD
jgi:hypothetical protein